MVSRFQGSGRQQEGGLLATHKQDFNAHRTGGDWRHDATMIDMNPVIPAIGGATVQEAIENLVGLEGSGFVSIGNINPDGYSVGVYNVGATGTPTIREAFIEAFADTRLTNGGIVLVLAGTYTLTTTVEVPAGITIMGEVAGTIINGEMSEEPMFKVLKGVDRPSIGGDTGSGEEALLTGSPTDETRFVNLILVDNLNGNITSGGFVVSSMLTKPMIQAEISSRLTCEGVKFIGRVSNAAAVAARGKTLRAVDYVSTGVPAADLLSTHLTLKNCYFDGMQTMVDFSPGNGDLDNLVIDKCRARVFGDENTTDNAQNCFVTLSLCNATITNNFLFGAGTQATGQNIATAVCITSTGVGAGTDDVTAVLTGNSGGPTADIKSSTMFVDYTNSITSYRTMIYGNDWGGDVSTPWYITVGIGGNDERSRDFGDFNGSGAIDLLYNLHSDSDELPVTVFVQGGTYNVTVNDALGFVAKYNFVGVAEGAELPIFEMNLGAAASTDAIGNRVIGLGRFTKSIHFRSNIAVTSNYHSVKPLGNGVRRGIHVEDCIFTNVCLSVDDTISASTNENEGSGIFVRNCNFRQTDDFADNLGVFAPVADNVLLEGCKFTGAGYAAFIGQDFDLSFGQDPPHNVDTPSVTLRNCILDKTGFTFDDAHPVNGASFPTNPYLCVSFFDGGHLTLEDCQIMVDNNLSERTGVYAASVNLGSSLSSFVFLSGFSSLNIDRCVFNSPVETYEFSAVDYNLPGLFPFSPNLGPAGSIRINNSRFMRGSLPLKVGGNSSDFSSDGNEGIFVDGCHFYGGTTLAGINTLVDIELDPSTAVESPVISFSRCRFFVDGTFNDGSIKPRHLLVTTNYDAVGIVQIYAEDFDVFFKDCIIRAKFGNSPSGPAATHQSALVIDNTNGGNADSLAVVDVSGCHIFAESNYDAGSDPDSSSAFFVRGVGIHIHNNTLQLYNATGFTSGGQFNVLFIENRNTSGAAPPPAASITGNVFSKRNLAGVSDDLFNGYIYVGAPTEGDGFITNNVFSDQTDIDTGNQESAVYTDSIISATAQWTAHTNKNQSSQIVLGATAGVVSINDQTLPGSGSTIGSSVEQWNDQLTQVLFFYQESSSPLRTFRWEVSLSEILGPDVEVDSIFVQYGWGSLPDTTNTFHIDIKDDTNLEILNAAAPTTGAGSATFSPSNTYRTSPDNRVHVAARWRADHSAGTSKWIEIRDFIIRFHWV